MIWKINKKWIGCIAILFALAFASCKKDGGMPTATAGTQPGFTASSTNLQFSIADSSNTAVTFSWSPSDFGVQVGVAYTMQLCPDSTFKDSAHLVTQSFTSATTSTSYTVAQFNSLILTDFGLPVGEPATVYARIQCAIATRSQNSAPLSVYRYSPVLTLQIDTPYSAKPIPVITPPDSLYIVGDATPGGWDNPVPVPSQKFTQIDQWGQIFEMVLPLTGGGTFLFLPVNGSWDQKYGGSTAGSGTILVGNAVPGSNTPGPATSGLYDIVVDFLHGTYTVKPITTSSIPANLYIVGDATAGGWDNPVPVPSQQFTQVSNGEYQITIPLASSGTYLFLPVNGDWTHKYGGASATGGALLADGTVPGSNTPGPTSNGTYLIDVNFLANTYTVTKQ